MVGTEKGNLKIGPLEIHPFLSATETYSDNIYKNYGGLKAESDFINTLSPGIHIYLPLRRHSLQVGYQADLNRFLSHTETNFTDQSLDGSFKLDFPNGLSATFSDSYKDAAIPRKAKEIKNIPPISDPFRALPYTSNDFNLQAKYHFADRWAIEGRYKLYDYSYKEAIDQAGDLRQNFFGMSFSYRVSQKSEVIIDYNYFTIEYPNRTVNSSTNHAGYLGVSFDPTARLSGFLKVGLAKKSFDQPLPGIKDEINTYSVLVDLNYLATSRDKINLKISRGIEEDIDTFVPYINTQLILLYRHILSWNEKISLNASLGYGTISFEDKTFDIDGSFKIRDDRQWAGGLGIQYALQRWLSINLQYAYTDNRSTFKNYDYTENRIWLTLSLAF